MDDVPWDSLIRAHAAFKAGGDDAAIAEAINAETKVGPGRPVAISAIVNYLRREGAWLGIKVAAGQGNMAAAAAVDLASDDHAGTVDLSLPIVQQLLPALVTGHLLTAAQLDAIWAMGKTTLTGWEAIGAPAPLNEYDIERARGGA